MGIGEDLIEFKDLFFLFFFYFIFKFNVIKRGLIMKAKNSVFKKSVNTRKWCKAAAVRAIKSASQAVLATIGTSAYIGAVNWQAVGSVAIMTIVISILTNLAGIPEVGPEAQNDDMTG